MNLETLKSVLKNRSLVTAFLMFEFLALLDGFTIAYIVLAESSVTFTNAFSQIQGFMAVVAATLVVLILNIFVALLAFTRLRTLTILIPTIIGTIIFLYLIGFALGPFFPLLGPVSFGLLIGVYYSFIFYGPAIWLYFRFRASYIAVGWLSIFYLSSLLIANALKIEAGGTEALTSLLRPDYLFLTAGFYFITMLLLIVDNSQSLARWRKMPKNSIKLPWQTIIPVIITLFFVTVFTNIASPKLWKVLWEKSEQGTTDDNGEGAKPSTEDDQPQDTEGGAAGNAQKQNDKVKMNPNQELKDKVNQKETENSILFTVRPSYSLADHKPSRFYWKMENMNQYSAKKGFYSNSEALASNSGYSLTANSFTYPFISDYSWAGRELLDQTFVFFDLESTSIIGADRPSSIRLLNGEPRKLFYYDSEWVQTESGKPFYKGDAYEVQSYVQGLNPHNKEDRIKLAEIDDPTSLTYSLTSETQRIDYNLVKATNTPFYNNRISQLANTVTQGKTTRVDKALAIEEYFKTNYEYTLNPGPPPNLNDSTAGQDRLNYFLFENQKGYCTYFASGMVAMLQSIGVPARVVGGFTKGTYSKDLDAYVITGGNAHAWVEVFLDGYGWVIFDPTPLAEPTDEEKQKELNKDLTKKIKDEIKEMQKDAENKKKELDNNPSGTNTGDAKPPKTSEGLEKFAENLNNALKTFFEILKIAFPLCLMGVIITGIIVPPVVNKAIDEDLKGNLRKRTDRDQIIAYFKLILRKLRKFNPGSKQLSGETALEWYRRLARTHPEVSTLAKDLEIAVEIYNRAIFRYGLEEGDVIKMQEITKKVELWCSQNMDLAEKTASLWLP